MLKDNKSSASERMKWITNQGKERTCKTETSEIVDPTRDGGFANLELGSAEYAVEEAERTFRTYKLKYIEIA